MTTRRKGDLSWASFYASIAYYAPAFIVVVGVFLAVTYATHQNEKLNLENLRTNTTESLGRLRAGLEGNIAANIHMMQGIAATLEAEGDVIAKDRFETIARHLLSHPSQLISVSASPDLVTRYVYPTGGYMGHLNWNLRRDAKQHAAVAKVQNEGKIVVTGPITLRDGKTVLVVHYPIVQETGAAGRTFWGVLSGLVDLDKLYADSGLPAESLNVAIVANEGEEGTTHTIYGNPSAVSDHPVITTVNFGTDQWQIFAVPASGWYTAPANAFLFKLLACIIGVMIIGPVLWVASLLRERQENISALRQREEDLRTISHRLEIALEASKIGVWELDVGSGILDWDARMFMLFDEKPTDGQNNYATWRGSVHPDDVEDAERTLHETIKTGRDFTNEFRIVCPSGEIRHIRAYGTMYRDSAFRKKIVGVNWNVTRDMRLQQELRKAKLQADKHNQELERARQHMEHNSLHDALTELPNRRYLDQHLKAADASEGPHSTYTLLHIDLDRFKEINDTLGHGAGDEILRHTAARLRENIRGGDFAARIGGDEFVVVCAGRIDAPRFTDLARRLIDAVNMPVRYSGQDCRVGASIGIASRSNADLKAEQLLINADIALYEAKRRGRNRVEHYTDAMRSLAVDSKRTNDAILRSIERNEFVAHFQPQFDSHTLEIVGVEALARWDHPEKGMLDPSHFIKAAEELNVIAKIDAAILDQSLLQMTRWTATGLHIPKVSVNISAQRLFDDMLVEHLEELNVRPGTLSFELLESISFDDKNESTNKALAAIRALGIDIEIDDFGTGYASILSLLKLSPRRLKIDRQLTRPILESEPQRRLISSIVDIGRSLNIEIIAEGVETMDHVSVLRDLGCQTLQGYALARPMSANDFAIFAKQRNWFPRQPASGLSA